MKNKKKEECRTNMTTLQNEEPQRKSSVYNQTGQSYFEQLSAYNRMSSHLRRILMAQSVVDTRKKKYTREKRLSSRSSSCSKSLDQILARRDIIDEVAYDTEDNPIEVLRMSLGCDPECPRKNKRRISEQAYKSCSIGCPGVRPKTSRRTEIITSLPCRSRTSNFGSLSKTNNRSSCGSARSCRFTDEGGSDRRPEVKRDGSKIGNERRMRRSRRRCDRVSDDAINETYSYDSSFESFSDMSETDSQVGKKFENSSPCASRVTSVDRAGMKLDREMKKLSDNCQRTDEAKYAKFLYEITQEIMLNGLYTDRELREIFKKHVEMNSSSLDRNRMLSEIYRLKMSLNVMGFSDDEDDDNDDIESFHGSGKFANLSPEKPPTPPKILDDNKLAERLRNHEESLNFDEPRTRTKNSNGKNTVVLVDANPEFFITERDVLVTLMEMKLEPQQVRAICKSLHNKSREAARLSHRMDRGNSPISGKAERSTSESFRSSTPGGIMLNDTRRDETTLRLDLRDRMTNLNGVKTSKKLRYCGCQCRQENSTIGLSVVETRDIKLPMRIEESEMNYEKPEVSAQTSLIVAQTRDITTSMDRMSGTTMETRSKSSTIQRLPEVSRNVTEVNDDRWMKNEASGEISRDEDPKTRRTLSSQWDEDEISEDMENIAETRSKSSEIQRLPEVSRNVTEVNDDRWMKNEASGESSRDEDPKTRRTLSSQWDEDEISEDMENIAETQSKSSEIQRLPEVSRNVTEVNDDRWMKNEASGESSRDEDPKTRRTLSSQWDEDEISDDMENIVEKMTKTIRHSSIASDWTTNNIQTDENESHSILGFKKSVNDDEIRQIPESSQRKSRESKKSVNSLTKNDPDRLIKKLSKDSTWTEDNISEESKETKTDMAGDQDSSVPANDEKNDEITDDELASLSEDISQVEELQIVEESSSMINNENNEKSQVPIDEDQCKKSESIVSKISDSKKLRILDESENDEIITMSEKSDQDSTDRLRNDNDNEESQRKAIAVGKIESTKYEVNEKRKGLTGSSVSTSLDDDDDDEKKMTYDDESSISEEPVHQETFDSGLNVVETNDNVDRTKIPSLDLKKKKRGIDDKIIGVPKSDKKSEKKMLDKQTRESQEMPEHSRNKNRRSTIINDNPSDENISDQRGKKRANENERGKKKEPIFSPCFAKIIGKNEVRDESRETSWARLRRNDERKRTTFKEEPMTTESDISLMNREFTDDSSIDLSHESPSRANEIHEDSNFTSGKSKNSSPRTRTDDEISLVEEHLEIGAPPRRDTIHRRTSLIRSIRNAMENLKKRRNTTTNNNNNNINNNNNNNNNVANLSNTEISVKREISSDTTIMLESRENLAAAVSMTKSSGTKNSTKNTSYDVITGKTKISGPSSSSSSFTLEHEKASNDEDPTMNNCRTDCRGCQSILNGSNIQSSGSSNFCERNGSASSQSLDSTEDNRG